MSTQPPSVRAHQTSNDRPVNDPGVADQLAGLARQITDRQAFQAGAARMAVLQLVVSLAPSVCWASFSALRGNRRTPFTLASAHPVATSLDGLQYGLSQGPCLEALATGMTVLAGDLGREQRWPQFTPEAIAASPARTMVSYPLAQTGTPGTTLNLYGDDPAALAQQEDHVLAVAAGAALVMAAITVRERADNLALAMRSNRQIGAAIGILMYQHQWTQDQAFAAIRRHSQRTHAKLREVAAEVVRAGSLTVDEPESRTRSQE